MDVMSRFPRERPSASVNTGARKREGGATVQRNANDNNDDKDNAKDDSFVDITQQHFTEARQSFMERVNSGTTKRRGTTSGQVTAASYNDNNGDDDENTKAAAVPSRNSNKSNDNEGFNSVPSK